MNFTSFSIKNRNCKVVNFGIREYERQAWMQRKGERDNANTPGIAAVWAEVYAYTRTYCHRASGMFDWLRTFSLGILQRELRNIEKQ